MNKNLLIGALFLVVLVLGGVWFSKSNSDSNSNLLNTESSQSVSEESMRSSDVMMEKNDSKVVDDSMMIKKDSDKPQSMMDDASKPTNNSKGSYEVYSPEKLALAQNGDVVLFFHASWCPYCRAAEKDINNNLSNIPEGVHILKVDYDSNVSLRQKYGVTYQHTFVQVDKDGKLLNKWSGSETLSAIVANIK